ncbi:MAG: hypothetical protein M5R36_12725 [Deltaproteobacteria bacterium]|nr:hypothetical protein [Deltaproteobacteria bacterium]
MKRIALIVIRDKPEAGEVARDLIAWIRARGHEALYLPELEDQYGIAGGCARRT